MINFSKVCFYFNIDDPLGINLIDAIGDALSEHGYQVPTEPVLSLIKQYNAGAISTEVASEKVYQLVYKAAFEYKIDLLPLIFNILLEHELKHVLKDDFIEKAISVEFFSRNRLVTHENFKEYIDSIGFDFKEYLMATKERVLFDMCRLITKGASSIEEVREIFTYYKEYFQIQKDDYADKPAIVRTLSNFGGTLSNARLLLEKYFPIV